MLTLSAAGGSMPEQRRLAVRRAHVMCLDMITLNGGDGSFVHM